jgi:hypothetical protein
MDETSEKTTKTPRRAPARRRRTTRAPRPPAHREAPHDRSAALPDVPIAKSGGSGSSGRGPIDDDDHGRKPERPDDENRPLLIALALLAVGAGVMSLRLLARAGSRRG